MGGFGIGFGRFWGLLGHFGAISWLHVSAFFFTIFHARPSGRQKGSNSKPFGGFWVSFGGVLKLLEALFVYFCKHFGQRDPEKVFFRVGLGLGAPLGLVFGDILEGLGLSPSLCPV